MEKQPQAILAGLTVIFMGFFDSVGGLFTCTVLLMGIDYIIGLLTAIRGKSSKTNDGKLNSSVGLSGIFKKIIMLLSVVMSYIIDMIFLKTNVVCYGVMISFIVNECISILENLAANNIKIPKILEKTISKINSKDGEYGGSTENNNKPGS